MTEKHCSGCKEVRTICEFWKDCTTPSGYSNHCKDCRKKNNSEWFRVKNFGITSEQYDKMLADQNFRCAICKEPGATKTLAVDHDHNSEKMKIRGLLCSNCNPGLGMFKDDISRLEAAIEYLKRYNLSKSVQQSKD